MQFLATWSIQLYDRRWFLRNNLRCTRELGALLLFHKQRMNNFLNNYSFPDYELSEFICAGNPCEIISGVFTLATYENFHTLFSNNSAGFPCANQSGSRQQTARHHLRQMDCGSLVAGSRRQKTADLEGASADGRRPGAGIHSRRAS